MSPVKKLNIGFVSTRFAGTDGVTLETEKWIRVLEESGHRCFKFAGLIDPESEATMTVPEAFFGHPDNEELNALIFGRKVRERQVTDRIHTAKELLKNRLYEYVRRFSIDLLVAENCLSIPMHIPLGVAMTELIAETGIPTIGHHHDFWWERSRFLINAVPEIIEQCFPPNLHTLHHTVINSMIQSDLASRRGLSASVIYNVFDFDRGKPHANGNGAAFRRDFGFDEEDILILQPTRVVARKGIEQALYLVKQLDMPKVKLLISHSSGDEGSDYLDWILETARQQHIDVHLLYNRLAETRKRDDEGKRLYSLWDVYPHVDLVTYPSLYEGFGNAFLEAVYFMKPILVNRYTVYIVDIEPKGFQVISMDGFLTQKNIAGVREILTDREKRKAMTEHNFDIAKRFFSYAVLKRRLEGILYDFFGASG
ncbi:MAG: glycosyltransferase family 4 protein [Spirochaetales bacterium]|nr:glycosyltransferase family 4 protein [Spirochaetales bacterium]